MSMLTMLPLGLIAQASWHNASVQLLQMAIEPSSAPMRRAT